MERNVNPTEWNRRHTPLQSDRGDLLYCFNDRQMRCNNLVHCRTICVERSLGKCAALAVQVVKNSSETFEGAELNCILVRLL